jgi:methylmalonyl-CoA mutase N-terminal domain/subunit
MERTSESGFPIDPVRDDSKLTDFRPDEMLGWPAKYPFTRGVYPRMSLDRSPTMWRYAGERVIVGVNRFSADGEEPDRPLTGGTANVLYPLREALRADAALGEVCEALRDVWGTGRPERI